MKRLLLMFCGTGLVLLFALALPVRADKDDFYTVNSQMTDSQTHDSQGGDHQKLTIDSTVDSNRGEHFEEHSSNESWDNGSSYHDHEDITTNGHQDSANHWTDDGTTDHTVDDFYRDKDGSSRHHRVETHTDKDGNEQTVDTYETFDAKGNRTFHVENRSEKKAAPPVMSTSPSAEQKEAQKQLQQQRIQKAAKRVGEYADTIK
jgi:hypothetical protein